MLRVMKSGNFSKLEEEVNVQFSCMVMFKITLIKRGGGGGQVQITPENEFCSRRKVQRH